MQGREKLHRVRPDVILMDIRMPNMDEKRSLYPRLSRSSIQMLRLSFWTFDDDEFIFPPTVRSQRGFDRKSFNGLSRQSIEVELHQPIRYQGLQNFHRWPQSNFAIYGDRGKC